MEKEKTKYLYGAAVQGIQGYIFQTSKLADIVGASELVRKICTDIFKQTVGENKDPEANQVISAAGNIKYVFDSREDCEKVVRMFPKAVIETAPGVTVSQAVEELDSDDDCSKKIDKLEELLRAQRNKPMKSTTVGSIGILRSRKTGQPVEKIQDKEYLDAATSKKRDESPQSRLCVDAFGEAVKDWKFAHDVSDMCGKNNWLAVIHADGNGLGKIVAEIGTDRVKFKEFSKALDKATKAAAQAAFKDVVLPIKWDAVIPIRPVVIGGDDFTVICRGDIAISFVNAYLKHFEEKTKGLGGKEKLTACAGVAFIKSSYPFYYGYDLAEALCSEAKNRSNREHSCLMFHKVQDSFVTSYKDIVDRELTLRDGWSYLYGPYYLNPVGDNKMTIDQLLRYPDRLKGKEGNALKSGLRRWMTCLSAQGGGAAEQLRKRILAIALDGEKKLLEQLLPEGETTVPVYDVLSLCSVVNKETIK